MVDFEPLSATRHGGKRWRPSTDYGFARNQSVIAVTAAEMMRAAPALPIAFQFRGEKVLPVAILGVQPDCNLMVAADGRWLGSYIPAALRAYPFLLKNVEGGKQVLCIDSSATCLSEGPGGTPLFAADGKLSPALDEMLRFLTMTQKSRQLTLLAGTALAKHELLKPWPIRVPTAEGEQAIDGFFQIDEAALGKLDGDAMIQLRDVGALTIAYCQLISMQHIGLLGQLAEARAKATVPDANSTSSVLDALSQGGTLKLHGF